MKWNQILISWTKFWRNVCLLNMRMFAQFATRMSAVILSTLNCATFHNICSTNNVTYNIWMWICDLATRQMLYIHMQISSIKYECMFILSSFIRHNEHGLRQ
jgi:hypothetical protein